MKLYQMFLLRKVDLVVIQCSTIAPDESHKIADLYSSKGIKIISVPILGGIAAAEKGELILIAAGASTDYDGNNTFGLGGR
jgi:3-hydroxyisobutyrate dehydrogenase